MVVNFSARFRDLVSKIRPEIIFSKSFLSKVKRDFSLNISFRKISFQFPKRDFQKRYLFSICEKRFFKIYLFSIFWRWDNIFKIFSRKNRKEIFKISSRYEIMCRALHQVIKRVNPWCNRLFSILTTHSGKAYLTSWWYSSNGNNLWFILTTTPALNYLWNCFSKAYYGSFLGYSW